MFSGTLTSWAFFGLLVEIKSNAISWQIFIFTWKAPKLYITTQGTTQEFVVTSCWRHHTSLRSNTFDKDLGLTEFSKTKGYLFDQLFNIRTCDCDDQCYLCGGPWGLKKFFSWGGKTAGLWGGEELCSRGEAPDLNWKVSEIVDGAAPKITWQVALLSELLASDLDFHACQVFQWENFTLS